MYFMPPIFVSCKLFWVAEWINSLTPGAIWIPCYYYIYCPPLQFDCTLKNKLVTSHNCLCMYMCIWVHTHTHTHQPLLHPHQKEREKRPECLLCPWPHESEGHPELAAGSAGPSRDPVSKCRLACPQLTAGLVWNRWNHYFLSSPFHKTSTHG